MDDPCLCHEFVLDTDQRLIFGVVCWACGHAQDKHERGEGACTSRRQRVRINRRSFQKMRKTESPW
jgi:hypothetical protein